MKIGIIIGHPTQFEGPFFRYAAQDKAHEIRVIYTDPDRMEKISDPELGASFSWGLDLLSGYPYTVLPRAGRIRWLLDDIRKQNYDLFIVNGYSKSEYLLATLIARWHGTRTALRLDSVLFNNTSAIKRLFKRALFLILNNLYRHFFAIGSLTVEYLRYLGIKEERISIFSYVIDIDYFKEKSHLTEASKTAIRNRYGLPEDSTVILSVAKFNEREAPWDLLKAFCSIARKDLYLLLVGDGEQRAALEAYAHAHPECYVIFAGYVPYVELPAHYGAVDVFVHPALDEPWGVSVQEALACGLPVIASSKVGAAYDLIQPHRNGYIYEAGNAVDLSDRLADLLVDFRLDDIRRENARILSRWDYASTWRNILLAGQRYV